MKKQKNIEIENIVNNKEIEDIIKDNMMIYSLSVILDRAIPDVKDGLKPVQRRIVYAMTKEGVTSSSKKVKSNAIVGTTMGKYHPHGDSSIYDAMVRITEQNESLLLPLIDGKGNFGKHYYSDSIEAASSRYTEARLSQVADEFGKNLKKHSDIFIPNYDNTTVEPRYLPCSFPHILANSSEGLAVGLASKIPSFNLEELCNATIERIKHPRKNIMEIMPAPDFPTGAQILYNKEQMEEIYKSGKGSFSLRSTYTINEKKRTIDITGIPFSTTIDAIISSIIKLTKLNKIKEISDINDTTGLEGMKISIDYKNGVDPELLMQKLFALTPLQSTFSCNFNVLIDSRPVSAGVYQILDAWIENRRRDVKTEIEFDIKQKEDNLHLLEALEKILLDIDKCISLIRKSKNDEEVIANLKKAFKLDDVQAEYVANIRLRNLNKDYILNRTKNIKDLKAEIKELKQDLKSGIDKVIISQLKEVSKKYGKPRKTEIVYDYSDVQSSDFNEVENFESKYIYTKDGYLKKIPLSGYRETSLKFKAGDSEKFSFDGDENSEILLFSSKGRVHKLYGSKIKAQKPQETGELILSLVNLDSDEEIVFINPLVDGWFVIAFENGKVVRIPSASYKTETMRKVLKNGFNTKQKFVKMYFTDKEDSAFTLKSSQGKFLSFKLSQIPERQTTSSDGVYVLRAKDAIVEEFKDSSKGDKYLAKRIPSAGTDPSK